MRYVTRYRMVETRWDGSQVFETFDTREEAEDFKQWCELPYTGLQPQYRSDFKVEEVDELEDDDGRPVERTYASA